MTSEIQIVMPPHADGTGRLIIAQLMTWVEAAASAEAHRHARSRQVITAAVDNLSSFGPAFLDETIRMDAKVIWTGRTSLEVRVDSYAEPAPGKERLINQTSLLFIALDDKGKPAAISPFKPSTEEEKQEWNKAEERQADRLKARGDIGL